MVETTTMDTGRTILNSSNGFTNNTVLLMGDVRPTATVFSQNSSSSNYDYYGQNK